MAHRSGTLVALVSVVWAPLSGGAVRRDLSSAAGEVLADQSQLKLHA